MLLILESGNNGRLLSLVRLNMDFAIINKILHETLLGGIPQQATRLKKIDRFFLPKVSTDMFLSSTGQQWPTNRLIVEFNSKLDFF